jgi:ketosteroid isomerase-like protein
MSNREDIDRLLRDAYDARRRGDIDALLRIFSDDVRFQLAGTPQASAVAAKVSGREDFRSLLTGLVRTFELLDHKILSMTVEGDSATVHWRAKFRSSVTNEEIETELADVIKIKDGKISSFIEFCDTALAARMMGA